MKISIISLDKWGYNDFIAKELSNRGFTVNHFNFYEYEYIYPTKFHKSFNFFSKLLFNYNLKREHLNKILIKNISKLDAQDITLIINGDNLPVKTIKKIKGNSKYFITFLNDSIARYPRIKKIYPYFDNVFSFDPDDVSKYNFELATNYIYFNYNSIEYPKTDINIFNISSLDKRNETIPKFAKYFEHKNINYKLIAFSGKKDNNLYNYGIEHTHKIYSLNQVFELLKKSNILLDIQRPKQKGLSFRVFESIGLEKKLITTNTDIVNYDFYNSKNIMVIEDINTIKIPDTFFSTPYEKIDCSIVKKYHIASWVEHVFNL